MRILTFNHHESYLCSLAATGHQFDVICRYKDLDLSWSSNSRPVPANMELIPFDDQVKQRLAAGYYDAVICHTLKNLLWLFPYRKPQYYFVAHIPLFFHTVSLAAKGLLKKLAYGVFKRTHQTHFMADSEFKRQGWGEKGEVVVLTPEATPQLNESARYDRIIYVGNKIKERGKELGYPLLAPLLKRFPIQVIGDNPQIRGSIKPIDFNNYQHLLCSGRIYLYVIQQPYGDGYNTAMLEAMSAGLAVVTIENPSSRIIHNFNGLIGRNVEELATHLRFLLEHPSEVDRLGQNARKSVLEDFSQQKFIHKWNTVLRTPSA